MKTTRCHVISIGDNQCVLMVNVESSDKIYTEAIKHVVEEVFTLQTPSNVCKVNGIFKIAFIIPVNDVQDINAKLLSDVDDAFGCICNIAEHVVQEKRRITYLKEDIKYVQTEPEPSTEEKKVDKRC